MKDIDGRHAGRRSEARQDGTLARLLQAADPAADAELGPVDKAELRRTVLHAAQQRPSSSAWAAVGTPWLSAMFVTAALVVGAGLAFVLRGDAPPPASDAITGGQATAERPTTSVPSGADEIGSRPPRQPPPPDSSIETIAPSAVVEAAPRDDRGPDATTPSAIAAVAPASPADRPSRTLHLTAPRGTRIIWTLDPSFESPIDGQMPRQENAP